MTEIAEVIGWKFNRQQGMATKGGVITVFPGGIPSQEDQDLWTAEYEAANHNPGVISFDDFESRFTTQEWDGAYDYVREVDTSDGMLKRKALVQGFDRALARGTVDLLDSKTIAFMDALVSGVVITSERKDEILTP